MTKNYDDFVVTSRIRLARNARGLPFNNLSGNSAALLAKDVLDSLPSSYKFSLLPMNKLDEARQNCLMEQHLISPYLIKNKVESAVILSGDLSVSIMICEEDLIREQAILSGFRLNEAYEVLDKIDDCISQKVKLCFDPQFGYLTACPTNLGTGMRASVMVFLPALSMQDLMQKAISFLSSMDITVRGVYGEGSLAQGYLYQISNQKSLGHSEQEIIELVTNAVNHIIEAEKTARKRLMDSFEVAMTDKILRSFGALTNSYSMDSKEFMEQVALLKLGRYYKIFNEFDLEALQKLIIDAQPYSLQTIRNQALDTAERDIFRSEYARTQLKKLNIIRQI